MGSLLKQLRKRLGAEPEPVSRAAARRARVNLKYFTDLLIEEYGDAATGQPIPLTSHRLHAWHDALRDSHLPLGNCEDWIRRLEVSARALRAESTSSLPPAAVATEERSTTPVDEAIDKLSSAEREMLLGNDGRNE